MSTETEIGRWLLQTLYDNYDNYASSRDIAILLSIDESSAINGLNRLIDTGMVEAKESKYRLTDKGYQVAYQRATSFCPHL